jgi:hypothetical protein
LPAEKHFCYIIINRVGKVNSIDYKYSDVTYYTCSQKEAFIMAVTTVRLKDDTMAWAKEYADFKGMSVTGMLADLIEEARQDDEDYTEAMKIINSDDRKYISSEELKVTLGLL